MGIGPSNPQNMMQQQTQQQYSGPPQGGWQNWFQGLTAGKDPTSQTLSDLRGQIEATGARLGNPNAQGIIDSIILPEYDQDRRGRVIDVGQSFSGTAGSGKWQWGDWGWGDDKPSMGMGGQMGGSMGMYGQQMDPRKKQMQMHQQFRAGQQQRYNQRGTGLGPTQTPQKVQYY
jgi:hypothetical protein